MLFVRACQACRIDNFGKRNTRRIDSKGPAASRHEADELYADDSLLIAGLSDDSGGLSGTSTPEGAGRESTGCQSAKADYATGSLNTPLVWLR